MIILFDRVSHALEGSRRMIEFTGNFYVQFRMPSYRVVINRDSAIRRHKLTILGQDQRIDFE